MLATLIYGLLDTPYFKNDLSVLFWFIYALVILYKDADISQNNR